MARGQRARAASSSASSATRRAEGGAPRTGTSSKSTPVGRSGGQGVYGTLRNNERKSLEHLEQVRLPKLADVSAGTKALDITTAAVERYKSLRLKDGAPRPR